MTNITTLSSVKNIGAECGICNEVHSGQMFRLSTHKYCKDNFNIENETHYNHVCFICNDSITERINELIGNRNTNGSLMSKGV